MEIHMVVLDRVLLYRIDFTPCVVCNTRGSQRRPYAARLQMQTNSAYIQAPESGTAETSFLATEVI